MHKSIMQNLDIKKCYLCGSDGVVEAHHCMHGTANRRLADKDGLIVNLCIYCHRKLHDRGDGDTTLKQRAQMAWTRYNMANTDDWIARYGRNYL